MRGPSLPDPGTILAIGAHPDDIEIGCGGTLLALAERFPACRVVWVVLTGSGPRDGEARASAADFTAGFAALRLVAGGFRDGFLPHSGGEVKELFERLKGEVDPGLILTHRRDDLHQDHRLACELTWNTWRDHLILEYEIPKYDGDLGNPGVFVPLPERLVRRKVELVMGHFATQRGKRWFDEDLFRGLMRLRGMECNAPEGHAEAFVGRKLALALA